MLAIDTLKLAEDLKEGGFNEKQTATLVDLGRDLSNQALEKVATKDDVKALRDDLEALEERIKLKFEAEIKLLEHRMIIKLGTMIVVAVGLIVALDRLFPAVTVVTSATG